MSAEYYCSVDQLASWIRDWAIFDKESRQWHGEPPVDPNRVWDFARVAAVWERLRWDIHQKGAAPGDRDRLDDLTEALQELATELGLGTVDPDDFLPGDPARLMAVRRDNGIDPWYVHCMYAPRGW